MKRIVEFKRCGRKVAVDATKVAAIHEDFSGLGVETVIVLVGTDQRFAVDEPFDIVVERLKDERREI